MTIKVGVFGAAGRMGRTVCAAVAGDPALELVAAVDPGHDGLEVEGVAVADHPDALAAAGRHRGGRLHRRRGSPGQPRMVRGPPGPRRGGDHRPVGGGHRPPARRLRRRRLRGGAQLRHRRRAPHALRRAGRPWFETAEIIELHHDAKVDAPSGTAIATAGRMAAASAEWGSDPTTDRVIEGARGGLGPGGIPIHSVRLRGLVAHQEVLLGTTGQVLTLRHDSMDRTSFMPGVLLAVKAVPELRGVTVGLDRLLGF